MTIRFDSLFFLVGDAAFFRGSKLAFLSVTAVVSLAAIILFENAVGFLEFLQSKI
jgi:hypothetical protein